MKGVYKDCMGLIWAHIMGITRSKWELQQAFVNIIPSKGAKCDLCSNQRGSKPRINVSSQRQTLDGPVNP